LSLSLGVPDQRFTTERRLLTVTKLQVFDRCFIILIFLIISLSISEARLAMREF